MKRTAIAIILTLLPTVILLPVWRNFGLGASEDDILYYLPNRAFVKACIAAGEWPLFNHWNGLGRPFLADPQNAVFYPFTLLFTALPLKLAYPLHLWLHSLIAATGAYRLARGMRLRREAALFAAITFAFGGFMIGHRAHFAMQAAAAWLPWIVWQQDRLLRLSRTRLDSDPAELQTRKRHGSRKLQEIALLATFIALQCFAGHFQMVLLTLFGCVILVACEFDWRKWKMPAAPRQRRSLFSKFLPIASAWVLAIGLFAVQLLPTALYARICERADWSYWEFTQNSYALPSLLTFLNPFLFGNRVPNETVGPYWGPSHQCEQLSFIGVVALLLALVALRSEFRVDPRRRRWFYLLIGAALLALGRYGPLCPLLWLLPGSEAFRGPARALLLIQLALAILAATVIDDLARPVSPAHVRLRAALLRWRQRRWVFVALLIVVPFALAWAAVPWLTTAGRENALQALSPLRWSHLLVIASVCAAVFALTEAARRWQQPRILWLLPLVAAVELSFIGWTVDVPREPINFASAARPDAANEWLGFTMLDNRRLWTVTMQEDQKPGEYDDPLTKCVARTNLLEPKRVLTDYGPLQPKRFVRAFAMEPWGAALQPAELLNDAELLRNANVGWILLCDDSLPAPHDGRLVTTTPRGDRLYSRDDCRDDVWFADASARGAARIEWQSNHAARIWFDCRPARDDQSPPPQALVVSLIATPGWSASFAGEALPVGVHNDQFLSIAIPPEAHGFVSLRYDAPGLSTGMTISLIALGVLVAFFTMPLWSQRRRPASAV